MATVKIALPDGMKRGAEAQTRLEKIASMQRHVEEGLASGVGSRTPEALFDEAMVRAAGRSGR